MFDVTVYVIVLLLICVLVAVAEIVRAWIAEELFSPPQMRRPLVFEPHVLIAAIVFLLTVPALTLLALRVPLDQGVTVRSVEAKSLADAIIVGLLIPILIVSGRNRLADYGIHLRGWRSEARYGILGFLVSEPLVMIAVVLMSPFRHETQHPYLKALEGPSGDQMVIAITFAALVITPLMEELVFRVVLQGLLETVYRPVIAILVTAVAFVIVHPRLDQIPLFPLALVLGIVFHCRRSYIAVVVLHALFNAVNLCVELSQSKLV